MLRELAHSIDSKREHLGYIPKQLFTKVPEVNWTKAREGVLCTPTQGHN